MAHHPAKSTVAPAPSPEPAAPPAPDALAPALVAPPAPVPPPDNTVKVSGILDIDTSRGGNG